MKRAIFCIIAGLLLLLILMGFSSCADSFSGNVSDEDDGSSAVDTIAPAAVSDLTIISVGCDSVSVEWTPTEDSEIYALRYDTVNFDESGWQTAQIFSDAIPVDAETMSITIRSLTSETYYCFAVKGADSLENWSELSNVVCCSTLVQDTSDTMTLPVDTIPPADVDLDVVEGFFSLPQISFVAPEDSGGLSSVIVQVSSESADFVHYDSIIIAPVESGNEYNIQISADLYSFGLVNYVRAYAVDLEGNRGDFSELVAFAHRYQIVNSSCINCGRCYSACPNGAISYNSSTGSYVIDVYACIGCGDCVSVCPRSAIDKYVKKL